MRGMSNAIEASSTYQKSPDFIARKITNELVLIPLQRRLENVDSIFSLNETACYVWDLIDGSRTFGQICSETAKAFDAPEAAVEGDVKVLFEHLTQIHAILGK